MQAQIYIEKKTYSNSYVGREEGYLGALSFDYPFVDQAIANVDGHSNYSMCSDEFRLHIIWCDRCLNNRRTGRRESKSQSGDDWAQRIPNKMVVSI